MCFPLTSTFNIFCILEKKNASLFNQNNCKCWRGMGKITKESFICKGEQVFLTFTPLVFTVPLARLSLVPHVSYFLWPGVSSKTLKSFKPHPSTTNFIHPEKSFLTCSGQLQTCFPYFLGILPCCTYQSDCQYLLFLCLSTWGIPIMASGDAGEGPGLHPALKMPSLSYI